MAMTTAERLRSLISQDDGGGSLDGLEKGSAPGGLTDFESSIETWGFVYGLAYALTRLEDPFESPASVADRAHSAARVEFLAYNGVYEVPDRDELVKALEDAWEEVHEVLISAGDSLSTPVPVTPQLSKAINRIISTRGCIREGDD